MTIDHSFVIYMKVGPYCGYQLQEIIEIKQREERLCGQFFWGYGGVFCHPKRVIPFVEIALKRGMKPKLLFSVTNSHFVSPRGRASQQSKDRINWEQLPPEVLLVGNQFSLVAQNLTPVNEKVDLGSYSSMLGAQTGKPLSEYIKYRVDKSCAIYRQGENSNTRIVDISFLADLVEPYCIYVR